LNPSARTRARLASPLTRATAAAQVETFSVQQMAHALPPPPSPPEPPSPPPPRVPPLPPMPPGPPPDGVIGLRTWSPESYNSAPEGPDDGSNAFFYMYCGFGPACGGSGDPAETGFRAPFHRSVSQVAVLTTARIMIDQGTYRSSACPYECSNAARSQPPNLLHMSNLVALSRPCVFVVAARKITRHEVVSSNEAGMLSGLGLLGEHFFYPGQEDSDQGFSRFLSSGNGNEGKLHPLHMQRGVTLDECDDIVRRHQLLAPHGVWMVDRDHEDASVGTASVERLGDCGLFLGARSGADADLWRAFYRYARLVLRLGHTDTWLDEDIRAAAVHSSSERVCNGATSRVCLWWSEFDLDDEEFSCRPKRDASNIVTPSILLATLAENDVAYPPPSPPPPTPPTSPPPPFPPPGAIRCELTSIASTDNYKVPAFDPVTNRYVPVQQKCWRWDPGNEWPPYVAHRDVYMPRDRCSGGRSRDIQWTGGFKQSLLAKGSWDPLYQNNNDCPWKASMVLQGDQGMIDALRLRGREDNGEVCSDGADETKTDAENAAAKCEIGTNMLSCGIRKNLVIFGYAHLEIYVNRRAWPATDFFYSAGSTVADYHYRTLDGVGTLEQNRCVSRSTRKWIDADGNDDTDPCRDGGPGSTDAECYYGTHAMCGKRRFAFALEDAGPDEPDNTCLPGIHADGSTYGPNNGRCEDGLMWSQFAPGKNPCAPNTDLNDCGFRPAKRPVRVGKVAQSDTCAVESYAFTVTAPGKAEDPVRDRHNALCSDFSDDLLHAQDLRLRDYASLDPQDEQCGRGTQASACRRVAETTIATRFSESDQYGIDQHLQWPPDHQFIGTGREEDIENTLAQNNYRYREKATYINPNLAGQGECVSPINMLHNAAGHLVRPSIHHHIVTELAPAGQLGVAQEWVVWFDKGEETSAGETLKANMRLWPKHVCSDGGEGSVRVPFEFGVARFEEGREADDNTLFFMDFGCPYGSQPEACPEREGVEEYQTTLDELEQPTGPEFSNCFDADVPDFECCRAVNEFRIHGGGGLVGNDDGEDLQYCAYPDVANEFDLPNERKYDLMTKLPNIRLDNSAQLPTGKEYATVADAVDTVYRVEFPESCMARCDADRDCGSFVYYKNGLPDGNSAADKTNCAFYTHDAMGYNDNGFALLSDANQEVTDASAVRLYAVTDDPADRLYERIDKGEECGLHWTSYHHASTGCKAFCRAAFQRDGNDNTCMPAKPECANWLNANDFPKAQYVTVDAECICGAKLEEFQTAGKYVNTGTVLSRARARARQLQGDGSDTTTTTTTTTTNTNTTTTRYDEPWEWPDATTSGIDQFHGETPIASLDHTHTRAHTHTRTHTRAHTHTHTFHRWSNRMAPRRLVCRRAL
jgi:hypothetical protein